MKTVLMVITATSHILQSLHFVKRRVVASAVVIVGRRIKCLQRKLFADRKLLAKTHNSLYFSANANYLQIILIIENISI